MVKMLTLFADLSLGAQTSYAELCDMVQSVEMTRFATLRGSFHRRQIKGKTYVYFNFRDTNGRGRSAYVGPESERVRSLISDFEQAGTARRVEILSQRAQACIALGCGCVQDKHYRVIHKVASYGFFRRGGVLVGTHAFAAMGSMLGIRWAGFHGSEDAEFAHAGRSISVAMPSGIDMPIRDAITSLELGELPIREFSGRTEAQLTSLTNPELRIELIAPYAGTGQPVLTFEPGIAPEPRELIQFLLRDSTQSVAFAKSGACLVRLPDPSRFAVYNLIAYGEPRVAGSAGPLNHLVQAGALIEWHENHGRRTQLRRVWRDALRGGPAWRRRAEMGSRALVKRYPSLARIFA